MIGGVVVSATGLSELLQIKKQAIKMPALFIGHGSPMNALADNSFTNALSSLGKKIPEPRAILVVSAHWMTNGTWITAMEKPKTIHDFYGFPKALFDIEYPASGSPEVASEIQKEMSPTKISLDQSEWGLDHGTWSILRHMYPKANIPIMQLSLNMKESHEYHFKLGNELQKLRERGVLVVGSGNIVHNLRKLSWDEKATPHDWAIEFDEWSKDKILKKDFKSLQNDIHNFDAGKLSVPTMDHYYPLHYILGLAQKDDEINFEYEEIQNASISMRALSVGLKG
jgi:4,5-DOPA dioxygenase extradiol